MKYKTALVTGGAGFIGSHVVDALVRRRIKTYVVDDLSTGSKGNVNPNAALTKCSIASPAFPALLKKIKPEVVFHLAAQADVRKSVEHPEVDARVNILGTLALVQAIPHAGIKKIVFTSTGGAMYNDDVRPPFSEKIPAAPLSPYGISKRAGEFYLDYAGRTQGVSVTTLRLANVYGPRQGLRGEAGVIALFSRQMAKGKSVSIFGTGKQTRDYVYVSDVVQALMLSMERRGTEGLFHIGTGVQTDVNTIYRKLSHLAGRKEAAEYAAARAGEVMRSALDAALAGRVLGWKSEVLLDDGLARTYAWFQQHEAKR